MNETLMDDQLPQEPEIDPNKKYLEEYVGKDKKFSDVEALAKGKAYSDSYIKILERRMDEMRDDYLKIREENMAKAKLEELLDQFQKKQTSSNENTNSERSQEKSQPELDLTKIESLVSEKIKQSKVVEKETENFNLVKSKLKEQYGTRYQDVLSKQIDELGLTTEEVNSWAKKSPEAFFRMMKMDVPMKQPSNTLPNSNVRSDSFKPSEKKRTWSYYQEMKKTNPKEYLSRETNIQMNKDLMELGEAFMDGDYFTSYHRNQ